MAIVSAVVAAPVLSQVVMDANATTTIISNVNSLYNNIFTFVGVLVALGGVVFPIVLTRYQNNKLKLSQEQLAELIRSEISSSKSTLLDDVRKELALDVKKVDDKVSKISSELTQRIRESEAGVNAKAHHAQANNSFEKKLYDQAILDYFIASSDYAVAKDEFNLNRVLPSIIKTLKEVKRVSIEQNDDIEIWFNKSTEGIKALNQNGRYTDDIKSIKLEFNTAKTRN